MTDTPGPRHPVSDSGGRDLEGELRELGRTLAFPAPMRIAASVRARLDAAPIPRRSFWSRTTATPLRTMASVAAIIVLLFAIVLVVSPRTRTTIADRLGVPGIGITTSDSLPAATGETFALGRTVSLPEATWLAGFELVPPPPEFGEPTGVFVRDIPTGAQVSFVYPPSDKLPEVSTSGIGLLVMQFVGTTNENFIQKQLGPDTTIEIVSIDTSRGFWLAGSPHVFFYQDYSGDIHEETIRLTGNVLLWQDRGRTLRIESALDRDTVVRIAESMTQ